MIGFKQQTKYEALRNTIVSEIKKGIYKPGDKIPGEKELGRKYKINAMTVNKALAALVEMNIIERHVGKGTFVSQGLSLNKFKFTINTEGDYRKPLFPLIMEELKKKNPHTKFQILQPGCKAGKPDLLRLVPSQEKMLASELMDLNTFIKNDRDFKLSDLYPEIQKLGVFDGKRVAIPFCFAPQGIACNLDLFEQAGVEVPDMGWSWADLKDTIEKLNDSFSETDKTAFAIEPAINRWINFVWQNHADMFSDGKFIFNSLETKEALNFFFQINNYKGQADPGAGYLHYLDLFSKQKIAMTMSNRTHLYLARRDGFRAKFIPLPAKENRINYLTAEYLSIPKESSDPENAWAVIKFFLSERIQSLINQYCYHYPVNANIIHDVMENHDDRIMIAEIKESRSCLNIPNADIGNLIMHNLMNFWFSFESIDTCLNMIDTMISSYTKRRDFFEF